jgi:hypothetical protein
MFDRMIPSLVTSAAAVSSHEVSRPRIMRLRSAKARTADSFEKPSGIPSLLEELGAAVASSKAASAS